MRPSATNLALAKRKKNEMEAKMDGLNKDMDGLKKGMEANMDGLKNGVEAKMDGLKNGMEDWMLRSNKK